MNFRKFSGTGKERLMVFNGGTMIGGMTCYQILWFFVIYSVLGWCVEVAYHAVTQGKVVNRGFLNGPVCPVYGFGMLAILAVFNSIEADMTTTNGIPLFLGGMALTTSIELFAGWGLDMLFHARWWDYSDQPLNLHGYICLRFSLIWGLGTVFMYRIVHPVVAALSVSLLPENVGWVLLALLYVTYAADLCLTVITVRNLNHTLDELDKAKAGLRMVSDTMSQYIGEGTLRAANVLEEGQAQAALARTELINQAELARTELVNQAGLAQQELRKQVSKAKQEYEQRSIQSQEMLKKQYEELRARLYAHPLFGAGRLVRAFPHAVHRYHNDLLTEFRRRLEIGTKEGAAEDKKGHTLTP